MNAETLARFAGHLTSQDFSAHTVTAYRRNVAAFHVWLNETLGEETSPVQVTLYDLQRYRAHLINLNRTPATVNQHISALRAFFAWLVAAGELATDPTSSLKGIQHVKHPPKALTSREVYQLQRAAAERRQIAEAQAADDLRNPAIVLARRDEAQLNLLLYAGLRVAEAAALRLSDVEISPRKGQVTVRLGKGMKARTIPLHKLARAALAAYLEVRPAVASDHFFVGQRGPMSPRGIQLRIEKLGARAGIRVTPHMLRHTFATRLLREGNADLVTVARLMGHSNVATTAIYTQPTEEDLARAVDGVT